MSIRSVREKILEATTRPDSCVQSRVTGQEADGILGEALKDGKISKGEAKAIADLYDNASPRPRPAQQNERMTKACPENPGYHLTADAEAKVECFILRYNLPLPQKMQPPALTQAIPENGQDLLTEATWEIPGDRRPTPVTLAIPENGPFRGPPLLTLAIPENGRDPFFSSGPK